MIGFFIILGLILTIGTNTMTQTTDEFAYLRHPNWPKEVTDQKIINFLENENTIAKAFFEPLEPMINDIFNQIKARIPLKDFKPPVQNKEYTYFQEIGEHDDYWKYFRKDAHKTQIILDVNILAKGHEFCTVTAVTPSPDNQYLAYCINLEGGEDYTIVVKSLKTGEIIDQKVTNSFGQISWHANSKGFFYVPCGDNWRAQKVMLHRIGDLEDITVYEEKDSTYWVDMQTSLSHDFLFITPHTGERNEVWSVDLRQETQQPRLLKSRDDGHITHIDHHGEYFYALINDMGKNFRLVRTSIHAPWSNITQIIPHSKDVYLDGIEAYQNFLLVSKKNLGVPEITAIDHSTLLPKFEIDFSKHGKSKSFAASALTMHYESNRLRYTYSSLCEPSQIWEYVDNDTTELVKKITFDGFDPNDYEIERIYSTSDDGTQVPISLIYKKSTFKKDGSNPLYLYGYGSYGISMEPQFRPHIFPLLDKGFVYAIAHIRGGADLGHYWYEAAKFLTKKRTFEDFISCAKHLCDTNYTSKGNIAIDGRSAGGMLIGYAINTAPDLFKAAVLGVPFVDVLNTMLDETLPLTATEFEEWGNPKDPQYYDYIKSYSPYDNVKAQNYPAIFMTTGIKDPRVGYWEPAKFLAKIKSMKLDKNPLLMKTNMAAGHFGKSSRFEMYREYAQEYAFILHTFLSK